MKPETYRIFKPDSRSEQAVKPPRDPPRWETRKIPSDPISDCALIRLTRPEPLPDSGCSRTKGGTAQASLDAQVLLRKAREQTERRKPKGQPANLDQQYR